MAALYLFLKEISAQRTMIFSTFDNNITIVVKTFKDGIITIQQIQSPNELHPRDIIQIVSSCFEGRATFANVRAIHFDINKVPFRCTKQNLDADAMMRHYWKNNGAKTPAIYE